MDGLDLAKEVEASEAKDTWLPSSLTVAAYDHWFLSVPSVATLTRLLTPVRRSWT